MFFVIVRWSPVFKSDFYIFFYDEQLRKTQGNFIDKFFVVSYLLKVRSLIPQFSKPDNIWTYNTIKHLKIINFCTPLNFT